MANVMGKCKKEGEDGGVPPLACVPRLHPTVMG